MSDETVTKIDNPLMRVVKETLKELEDRGDIVICSNVPNILENFFCDKLQKLMPNDIFSTSELIALRALVLYAIKDKRFFDWEMPTLTGFDAQGFLKIAEKLPKG